MKITNRLNLPDALVRAVVNDSYSPGDGHFTATGLLKPARQVMLQKQYSSELEEDVSDRIWSLLGQATHTVLERAGGNEIKEQRLYADIDGWSVSAQIDNLCLESGTLTDYKVTTSWKFKKNKPPDADYIHQLNIQAEILRHNNYDIKGLYIVGILRDWSKLEAQRNADYPQLQVVKQQIPMWASEQVVAFIKMRISSFLNSHEILPNCTSVEMWERDSQWAVTKKGQKRAVKLFSSPAAAEAFWRITPDAYDIKHRPGERIRCNNYCSVNKYCLQYQAYLSEKESCE